MHENLYLVSVNISKNAYSKLDYRFNGKELDPETGNYYYGARYYDPKISVWLSVDPLAHETPSWTPYRFSFNNPLKYIDPDGRQEYPNDFTGPLGPGDWREDDRIAGNDVFSSANAYNLQQVNGYSEYSSIEQRAGFYKWFQTQTESEGYDTKWAGAAFVVASQMSNIHSPFSGILDNAIEGDLKQFAEDGNEAIFNNVFPDLTSLYNGPALKGKEAAGWDAITLRKEQRDVVGPMYGRQNLSVLNALDQMSKGLGMYSLSVPRDLRMDSHYDVTNWRHRFAHGLDKPVKYWNRVYSQQ